MVESKAEKGNRKWGKGLIDFKERKVGRVTTTQKNSGLNKDDIYCHVEICHIKNKGKFYM